MPTSSKPVPEAPPNRGSMIPDLDRQWEAAQSVTLNVCGHEFAVHDKGSYERLIALVDRLETIAAVQEGLESMKRGEGRPMKEVMEELREKYELPDRNPAESRTGD